jgi:hypothetical protein
MTRRAARVTGWAVAAVAVVIAMSGCLTDPQAETPAQVRKQAGMVSLMISSAMGTGQTNTFKRFSS